MDITDYGLSPSLLETIPAGDADTPARIVAVHRERYALVCTHGECYGRLKSGVYTIGTEALPTTGDFVLIRYNPDGDSPIVRTLPRTSFFSRRNPTRGEGEQAVAANFDYVFVMQSLNADFNPRRLERYLTLAWQSGAVPIVVLTKSDLTPDPGELLDVAKRIAPGVDVFAVSAKTGAGLDALSAYLQPGKTIVLLGSSGVGKSSFVNALAGRGVMAVNEIRADDDRGRHTTTHRQLLRLESGVMVIDTPGMRELGMWTSDAGLEDAFPDVERCLGQCKFSDCRHEREPGCAIRAAIESGELSAERWAHYQKLLYESRLAVDPAQRLRERAQFSKQIAKWNKQYQRIEARLRSDD